MIAIKCTSEDLIPIIGSDDAAAMDLKTAIDFILNPGEEITISTGVHVELPKFTCGICLPRSSMANHEGLHVVFKNTVGLIDSDYRGEILVKARNIGREPLVMFRGDRICQMVVVPHISPKFIVVDELSETKRGKGGFGHSGDDIKTK